MTKDKIKLYLKKLASMSEFAAYASPESLPMYGAAGAGMGLGGYLGAKAGSKLGIGPISKKLLSMPGMLGGSLAGGIAGLYGSRALMDQNINVYPALVPLDDLDEVTPALVPLDDLDEVTPQLRHL